MEQKVRARPFKNSAGKLFLARQNTYWYEKNHVFTFWEQMFSYFILFVIVDVKHNGPSGYIFMHVDTYVWLKMISLKDPSYTSYVYRHIHMYYNYISVWPGFGLRDTHYSSVARQGLLCAGFSLCHVRD